MDSLLFTIGGLGVPVVSVVLTLGLSLGLGVSYFEGKRRIENGWTSLDMGLWIVVGSLLGGWLGYVVIRWVELAQNWSQLVQFWEGKLTFPGMFLGGGVVLGLLALLRRRSGKPDSFWELADLFTPGLAVGVSAIWVASLALGPQFNYPLLPDIYGIEMAVQQVLINRYGLDMPPLLIQGVGITLALALGVAFWLTRKRWRLPGAACLTFTLVYCTGQFLLETLLSLVLVDLPLRVGPWQLAASFPWRLDQAFELGLALFSTAGLLALWRQAGKQVEPHPRKRVYQVVVGFGLISLVAASVASIALWRVKTANPDFMLATIAPDIPRLSPQAARDKVERGEAVLADIRDQAAYTEAHAAGAIFLPEEEVMARLEQLPRDKTLILYCA